MGYRIENYSLGDLRKISLPGKVVSTLFWVVPLGEWSELELKEWWRSFTEGEGFCTRLGLILMRHPPNPWALPPDYRGEGGASTIDLRNLLPGFPHMEPHHTRREARASRHLLILSAAFPQPGWALVVKAPADPREFENWVNAAVADLDPEACQSIRAAADAFRDRQSILDEKLEEPEPCAELPVFQSALDSLDSLLDAVEAGNPGGIRRSYMNARDALRSVPGFPPDHDFIGDLGERLRIFADLLRTLDDEPGVFFELLARQRAAFEKDVGEFWRGLDGREKTLLKWWKFLRELRPGLEPAGLGDYLRNEFFQQTRGRLIRGVEVAREFLVPRHDALLGEGRRRDNSFRERQKRWQASRDHAEADYRRALGRATTAQFELGPPFLWHLERVIRAEKREIRSEGYDKPRMIGWKLSLVSPDSAWSKEDLELAVREPTGGTSDGGGAEGRVLPAQGSLFADYVYYLYTHVPGMTLYMACAELLERLLGTREINRILRCLDDSENPAPTNASPRALVERIMEMLGWRKTETEKIMPLAELAGSCGFSGSFDNLRRTRVSLESLLKDLVAVCCAQLGIGNNAKREELAAHSRNYLWNRDSETWGEERLTMTVGNAQYFLKSVVPQAFPDADRKVMEELFSVCAELVEFLNPYHHENADPPPLPDPEQRESLRTKLRRAIEIAEEITGELPWHLQVKQSFGTEPRVVAGRAWSHGEGAEKAIRVLLWGGEAEKPDLLVWNPTRTNPVMTDARIL